MKRIILGASIAFTMFACGSAEETETPAVEIVDTESVQAIESATDKVEEGLTNLENDLNEMSGDIDSLLNGI